jgi:2,3-bisphosphoglycerate-independent phosphoglycerate mutase
MHIEALIADQNARAFGGPLVFAIMDGVGWGARDGGDAVHLAHTPNLDALWAHAPTRALAAHGSAVGLPSDDDMGNSEVGHNAIGAGRVVRQGAALVQDAIASGAIFATETFGWLVDPLKTRGTLHLCGLLSDGNVHAHIDHVVALIDGAVAGGVRTIRVHALADGRDVADPSFEHYLALLDVALARANAVGVDAALASGGGRMVVTMDRYEADWRIVARGWAAHVHGDAPAFASWQAALSALRSTAAGQSDQSLPAFVIADEAGPIGRVVDGDGFVLWNFRGDRALELTAAFESGVEFHGFERGAVPKVRFAGMMQYDGDRKLPKRYLVEPPAIDGTLSAFLVATGLSQFAVSETQKFGHVTYFWNGNRSEPLDPELERWQEIPSDRVSFDELPAMQASAITDAVLTALAATPPPSVIRLNWANGDMVGHTGKLAATIAAVEAVDREVGRLVAAVRAAHGVLLLTADHGNADDMWMRDKTGAALRGPAGRPAAKTSHTLAPVPLTIIDARPSASWQLRDDLPGAGLANLAATAVTLLGYLPPAHMAPSLVRWLA